ncbi:MAG: DsrH/TusB family sulfur metabolism protein [Promethearchaeia archaeon]
MKFLIVLTNDCVGVFELVKSLQERNHGAAILLLEDAVFFADKGKANECALDDLNVDVYISQKHLKERGLTERLALNPEIVDYPKIVDLLMEEYDRIISL